MAKALIATMLLFAASFGVSAQTVRYIHTDALGSVAVVTDQNRVVIERREYEPYGATLTAVKDGPGYTGHVSDAATGLSYMQQRYYDPGIGRFLSVDPVTANSDNGSNFNRYWYANNNPYKFTDPDGRLAWFIPVVVVAYRAYSAYDTVTSTVDNAKTLASSNASTGEKLAAGAEIAGGLVGGKGGRQLAGGAARLADKVGDARKSQVIYRRGDSAETATRLERKATEAENSNIGIHGVSGSTTKPDGPCSSATCGQLEAAGFKVHDTPTRADPNHKTIELPKPVTREEADRFNSTMGRSK